MRRKIEDPNGHSARAALAETCTHFHMRALGLAPISARLRIESPGYFKRGAVVQHSILASAKRLLAFAQSPEKLMPTLAPHMRASLRS